MPHLNPGDAARNPSTTSPAPSRRTVHLQTRREGQLDWIDRGPAQVPEHVLTIGRSGLVCEGVVYTVEDVFDDGRAVTVWAREDRNATPRRRRLPLPKR